MAGRQRRRRYPDASVAIGIPPFFEYEITSPTDGDILLPGEPFIYSVAAMAQPSARDDYESPVSLLMGTNVLTTFYRAAPYAILVTNPPAGSYVLTLAFQRRCFWLSPFRTAWVRLWTWSLR
jgi:hypothetical protein